MFWIVVYATAFFLFAGAGAALAFVARAAGRRLGVVDRPTGGRKDHARPTPLTGGWAVYAAFLGAVALGFAGPTLAGSLPEWLATAGAGDGGFGAAHYLANLRGVRRELAAIAVGTTWIFAVGCVDDIRPLGPKFKLAAQIAAVLPLLWAGISIRGFLPAPVGAALTVVWCATLMNSFNFIDNMDGLCATVAGAIALVLAVAAGLGGELLLPALFLAFAGTLAGYLVFNFHPASIFLGDSGSLAIGYLMGAFSVMTTYRGADEPTGAPILIPLAAMGVPLFDTASVMLIRLRSGAPLMVGDKNHFSHRLRSLGFSVRGTVATIGALTAATGLLALALRRLPPVEAAIHLLALTLLFVVVGAIELTGRKGAGAGR